MTYTDHFTLYFSHNMTFCQVFLSFCHVNMSKNYYYYAIAVNLG